jgi:hypothetical protein
MFSEKEEQPSTVSRQVHCLLSCLFSHVAPAAHMSTYVDVHRHMYTQVHMGIHVHTHMHILLGSGGFPTMPCDPHLCIGYHISLPWQLISPLVAA